MDKNTLLTTAMLLSASLLVSSCGKPVEANKYLSPDKRRIIETQVYNAGAGIPPLAKVILKSIDSRLQSENKEIFLGRGGWPFRARWVSNNVIFVEFCEASYVEYYNNIEINYPDNINVVVSTGKAISIKSNNNGDKICDVM